MTTDRDRQTLGPAAMDAETDPAYNRPALQDHGRDSDGSAKQFALEAARTCADSHCDDVRVFDVRGLSSVTDYIVIASGTSDRQIKGVGGYVSELARGYGRERLGSERDGDSRWLVLDYVEVMVHLFEPVTRAHYDLEMLWGDAEELSWRRSQGEHRPSE